MARISTLLTSLLLSGVCLPLLANPLSSSRADHSGSIGFEISLVGRCNFVCDDTTPEGEAPYFNTNDTVNGGCNSDPAVFQTMECGGAYCGTTFGYYHSGSDYRDTDWFLLDMNVGDDWTLTVDTETEARIFLIDVTAGCPVGDEQLLGTEFGTGLLSLNTGPLQPGQQLALWIGANWFGGDGTEYRWRADISGECQTAAAVELPSAFVLEQNAPNPFNPTTRIAFSLEQASWASLKVFDLQGSQVATLVDGLTEAGEHRVSFDASRLASGVYFYALEAEGLVQTRKMVLMK